MTKQQRIAFYLDYIGRPFEPLVIQPRAKQSDGRRWSEYKQTINYMRSSLWRHLNGRTINGKNPRWDSPHCRHYLEKGIELRVTREELDNFIALRWRAIQELRA